MTEITETLVSDTPTLEPSSPTPQVHSRKEWLKEWFSHWDNRIFFAIIILAFILRIYYLSANSAVWWDEADYLASAKHWFFNVPYTYNPQRGILFPLIIGGVFSLGLSEAAAKFVSVLIPSVGIVALTYFIGKEMYSAKVGLIASSLSSVFWVSLFWTARFSNDFLALFFQLLAIYCFWVGVMKKKHRVYTWLFGLFLALGFITRAQSALVGISLFLFTVATQRLRFLKNKDLWIAGAFFLLPFIPYTLWLRSSFGSALAFSTGYSSQITSAAPFGWYVLKFFYQFTQTYLFILLLIGLLTLADLVFGLDMIFKKESKGAHADFFWILTVVIVAAFFIFWLRGAEDRWVILVSVPIFLFIGKAGMLIYDQAKKRVNLKIAASLVILLIAVGMFMQFTYANPMILDKKDSYAQVKEAGIWMKDNSEIGDVVFSASGPQNTYYSERLTIGFPPTEEEFLELIKEHRPRYMAVSAFERHPDWAYGWPQNNLDLVTPVNGWFADPPTNSQPLMIVYAFNAYEKAATIESPEPIFSS